MHQWLSTNGGLPARPPCPPHHRTSPANGGPQAEVSCSVCCAAHQQRQPGPKLLVPLKGIVCESAKDCGIASHVCCTGDELQLVLPQIIGSLQGITPDGKGVGQPASGQPRQLLSFNAVQLDDTQLQAPPGILLQQPGWGIPATPRLPPATHPQHSATKMEAVKVAHLFK